ncbi:BTAD domain-containing putative transcriptional regulator [Streptomyces sp. NPDC004561]
MSDGWAKRLRFNILGPLEGWHGSERIEVGGLIQQRILVALLLDPGKRLTVSRLVEAAWAEEPPVTAVHQVRKAVADLRRKLPGGKELLLTDGPSYALATDVPLDIGEFDRLAGEARTAAEQGRPREAVRHLREAVALWRGRVLDGIGGPLVEAAAVVLEERRLSAMERYYELRLSLGETSELLSELREQTSRYPLQESLRGHLMLALYRSGRRAEALEEYGRVRTLLVEELGIEPGPKLARLHEDILVENPELAAPAVPAAPPAPAAAPEPEPARRQAPDAPRMLPYDLSDFVGRERELALLLEGARRCEQRGRGARVVAIDGMGGVGKTSLAVRAAYLLADEYPDGQLFIDLRGYAPDEQPVGLAPALGMLLRGLGIPMEQIPDDEVGRTTLWQSALAGRRLLILIDNAADAGVVRGLLPTSPGCLVLVTSRARLVELDGAEWVAVDVLAPRESRILVGELLGAEAAAADPETAAELARLCGHLPLAMRIAAARLRNRRQWTLPYLVARLRDENRKLDELSSGERGVAATLRLSYQVLPEDCRASFRILSLHPGNEIDVNSAAALLDLDVWDAEDHLEKLLDAQLLQQPELGRYTYHDLVRSFSRGLSRELPEDRRDETSAVRRLIEYYLCATESACELLYPGRSRRNSGIDAGAAAGLVPGFGTPDDARSWFDREHITLTSVVKLAVREGYQRHAVWLARGITFYLNARGNLNLFAELSRTAVAAARDLEDDALLGMCLSNLGVSCWKLGLYTEGIKAAEEGQEIARRTGDQSTQAHCKGNLGHFHSLLGRYPEALDHLRSAVALERELGTPRAEAATLTLLSALYEQWGRYREAVDSARRAVELMRRLGQHENAFVALTDLALALVGLGDDVLAEECLGEARGLCVGDREAGQVAVTLALSAELAQRRGDRDEAGVFAEQALELVGQSTSPTRRAKAENMLGRLMHERGEHERAFGLHSGAYETAVSVGYRVEEAYSLAGMAVAAGALGDAEAAAEQCAEAERIFEQLGVPAAVRRGTAGRVSPAAPV